MISAPKGILRPGVLKIFVSEFGGPKQVAKFLDVSERTVWRWLATGKVPRAIILALYWETQYGKSLIDSDQVNEIRLLYRNVSILQEQYQRAKDIVTGLRRLNAGTANEAYFEELPNVVSLPPSGYSVRDPTSLLPMALRPDGLAASRRALAGAAASDSLRQAHGR